MTIEFEIVDNSEKKKHLKARLRIDIGGDLCLDINDTNILYISKSTGKLYRRYINSDDQIYFFPGIEFCDNEIKINGI